MNIFFFTVLLSVLMQAPSNAFSYTDENICATNLDETTENMIKNPGFEMLSYNAGNYHGLQSALFADAWNSGSEFFFKYRTLALISFPDEKIDGKTFVHSGTRSLMLKGNRILAQNDQDIYIYQSVEIKDGYSYIFSAWIKADDVDDNSVCVQYAPIAQDGHTWISGYIKGRHLINGATHDWRYYQAVIPKEEIPSGTRHLIFFLRLKSFAGYVLFDDIKLTILSTDPKGPNAIKNKGI